MRKGFFMAMALAVLLTQGVSASPLQDMSAGKVTVDCLTSVHDFKGSIGTDISVTAGLGKGWGLQYRDTRYDSRFESWNFRSEVREANLIYKLNPSLQVFAYPAKTTGYDKFRRFHAADVNSPQLGVILTRKLGDRFTLYSYLSRGRDQANVEFGLSYALNRSLELTATYRHLTVEEAGVERIKQDYRGFLAGLTFRL